MPKKIKQQSLPDTKHIDPTGRNLIMCTYEPESEILGGWKDNVHAKGLIFTDDENDPDVKDIILSIPLEMFLDMQRTWLQEKLASCNHYKHYCGVMLGMECQGIDLEVVLEVNGDWIEEDDEGNGHLDVLHLPVYQVVSFDPNSCDPEHG